MLPHAFVAVFGSGKPPVLVSGTGQRRLWPPERHTQCHFGKRRNGSRQRQKRCCPASRGHRCRFTAIYLKGESATRNGSLRVVNGFRCRLYLEQNGRTKDCELSRYVVELETSSALFHVSLRRPSIGGKLRIASSSGRVSGLLSRHTHGAGCIDGNRPAVSQQQLSDEPACDNGSCSRARCHNRPHPRGNGR